MKTIPFKIAQKYLELNKNARLYAEHYKTLLK